MSGLGQLGGFFGANGAGFQAAAKDLDIYQVLTLDSPAVDTSWFGTASGTVTASTAITLTNQNADWPRNFCYSVNGISSGTYGGTFTVNGIDQFGASFTESVAIAAAVNGGTTYGTQIAAKFVSGSFISQGSAGTFIGTARVGLGTAANGSAASNWFGLLTKVAGTSDVKNITWISTNTVTTLNKGTALGTLVGYNNNGSLPSNAFQGTSGVAVTDHYRVILKPSFDNIEYGTMAGL